MIELANIGAPAFVLERRKSDGIFVYREFNPALERITGLIEAEVSGLSAVEIFGPEIGSTIQTFQDRCAEEGTQVEYETPVRVPLGDCIYQTSLTPITRSDGGVDRILGISQDVSQRRRLENDLKVSNIRLHLALDALGGAHWFYDPRTQTFELSEAFDTLLGAKVPRVMTLEEWLTHVVEEDRNDTCFLDLLAGRIEHGTSEFRVHAGNGETRWLRCRRRSARDGSEVAGIAGVVVDITSEKRQQADLSRQAASDALTGLANRRRFDTLLADVPADDSLAVLMIDVDHFKAYNDHYGHMAGDGVLKNVAQVLDRIATGSGGLAARFGGEEFVILLRGVDLAAASAAAERVTRRFEELILPHAACPRGRISVSIGVASGKMSASSDASGLVTDADRALYRAKAAGRGCYRLATAEDSVRPFPSAMKRLSARRPADALPARVFRPKRAAKRH